MHSWQNGTRCRDDVNVLWCHSHLVWLVFEGSIPTCACFHLENFFVTCSCCFFYCFFRSSKREDRQARGRCMSIGYKLKHGTVLFTKNKESS